MRLVDRYILREIGGIFLFGVVVFTTLLLTTHLFFLARLGAETTVPIRTNFALLVLRVPYFVAYSLPMATLLAALLAFGRLSDRNEVTALRTSGWSLGRVAAPVIFAGVAVAICTISLNEWVVPVAEERYRAVLNDVIRTPTRQIQHHVLFREPVGDVETLFYARELDSRDGTMSRVVIIQFQQQRPARVIEAEQARYGPGGWVLHRGTLYLLGSGNALATTFGEMRVALTRSPKQLAAPRRDPYDMTIGELRRQIAALRAVGESAVRHAVSLQWKLAIPTSSVIFALLAVPLGLRPQRSGRATGLGLTVLVLLSYYVMMSVTLTLGERGQIPSFWAAWLPNLVLAGVGSYLLWLAR